MARLAQILLLSAVLGLVFGGGAARAQECSVSDGESIVQGLLDDVIAPFNAAWPAICEASGLDPFDNVFDGSVNLGCGLGDLGNTVCGLQASSCKSMWADVDVSQITGLENLDLTSLTVTSTNASDGTSCPYKSSAVDGTSFSCSYYGEGTGTAAVGWLPAADEPPAVMAPSAFGAVPPETAPPEGSTSGAIATWIAPVGNAAERVTVLVPDDPAASTLSPVATKDPIVLSCWRV